MAQASKDYINHLLRNVEQDLPVFLKFIPKESKEWKTINEAFSTEYQARLRRASPDKIIYVSATIYDTLIKARKGDIRAQRMLFFINKILNDLHDHLTSQEVKLVEKNILDILKSMDYRFWNFVGEMSVLKCIMDTGLYSLVEVEVKMPDSPKPIDFMFKEKKSGGIKLIEVSNVFLDDDRVEADDDKIAAFIEGRVNKKRAEKNTTLPFDLIFVFGGSVASLKVYGDFIKQNKLTIPNVLCYGYLAAGDSTNTNFNVRFAQLSHLFD